MTAVVVAILAALSALAGWLGLRAVRESARAEGRAAAETDHLVVAKALAAELARHDAETREAEAADVRRILADAERVRPTAGDQLGGLIAEARERGGR